MTTPTSSVSPDGTTQSPSIVERYLRLADAVRSELRAAVTSAVANAVARGHDIKELEKQHMHGREHFRKALSGGDMTLLAAIEVARVCGYRLHITLESLDGERVATPMGEVVTAFEAAAHSMKNNAMLKDMGPDQIEDLLRQIMGCYFENLRDRGYYLTTKGSSDA